MTSTRLAALAALVAATTGCYATLWKGPQLAKAPKAVQVSLGTCTTPAYLFDCKTVAGVGLFLQDYLTLNGLGAPAQAGEGGTLKVDVREDRNVVSLELALEVKEGQVWRAQAQGGDVLLALVRFEQLAREKLSWQTKYATSDDLATPMKKVGRTRMVLTRGPGTVGLEYK